MSVSGPQTCGKAAFCCPVSKPLPTVRAVNHYLTGWCCLISRIQGLAGIKKIFPLGTINPHLRWLPCRKRRGDWHRKQTTTVQAECFHTWTFHVGSGLLPPLILLGDIGCFHQLSSRSDGGQPVFFKSVRLCWEPQTSMRKTRNVYFGLQQKLSWTYTRDDMSTNRLQVAAAHFLLVSLYVNRLCLPGKRHCCLLPQLLLFPQCSQYVLSSTDSWHWSNQICRPAFLICEILLLLIK